MSQESWNMRPVTIMLTTFSQSFVSVHVTGTLYCFIAPLTVGNVVESEKFDLI